MMPKYPSFLTLLGLVFSLNCFAANVPNPETVTSYAEVKALLGLTEDGQESRTFHGIVVLDADNDLGKRKRMNCMSLKFVADDKNQRLDYMYKGWLQDMSGSAAIQNQLCNFMSPKPVAAMTQHILCIKRYYPTEKSRYVDLSDTPRSDDGTLPLRGLDISNGVAISRCQEDFAIQPLLNGETRNAADILGMKIVYSDVLGSAARVPQKTLTIRLDLSSVNPAYPEFKKVDYVIMLDQHPADIKEALKGNAYSGDFDVNYVDKEPGKDTYSYQSADFMESALVEQFYPGLNDQYRGAMDIEFTGNEKGELSYQFHRKLLPEAAESDDRSCRMGENGEGKTIPRSITLKHDVELALSSDQLPPEVRQKLQGLKAMLDGGIKAQFKLAEAPIGIINATKCIDGVESAMRPIPLMEMELSEEGQKLEMRAFLGDFNEIPGKKYMGFSSYSLGWKREKE